MNNLSWLLLIGDIVQNISITISLLSFFGLFGFLGLGFVRCLIGDSFEAGWPIAKIGLWIFIPMIIVTTLIPSKQTIYMIAASEMGETVINSPETKKMFDLLKSKVEEQLAPIKTN